MSTDSTRAQPQGPEEEIERLAQEIGRLIRGAEPQRREDLKELAYTLIREEMIETGREELAAEGSPPGPFNPLGTGVLIFVLGAGLSFIFGPVGLLLMLGGVIFVVWGAAISLVRR
ncbi:MAG TPA: hypothetical protein VNL14_09235 [Candidatus Acidoferrales bacterium]|nr:hypothetical protein [Candidatus Acidoferrales bacterium]